MNKEKEEMLERLRNVKDMENNNLSIKGLEDEVQIENVKFLGKTTIIEEIEGEKVEKEINLYAVLEGKNIKYYSDDMCLGYETEGVGIIPSPEYQKKYEENSPIKDVVENLKEKSKQEKPQEEQDKELKIEDLNELEEENEDKSKDKEKSADKEETKKKRKPEHVIEVIDPDKAKMDYWQTIKQAFNLPPEVDTLAFAYPDSSEDKVDYANITIRMLDKDGYILDNYDIDDYFEFDTSTGNNPTSDNTQVDEKDENRGKTQIDSNYTMIRLKAKQSSDQRSYISLEQKNGMGDYNDINAGRKVVGGTQNVEHQLETRRFKSWDSIVEQRQSYKNGEHEENRKYEETEEHKSHGDEGYLNDKNTDGNLETRVECEGATLNPIIDGKEVTWKELAIKWGYYENGKPNEEKAKEVYQEYRENNRHLTDEQVVQEVSDDLYDQTPGGKYNR